MASVVAAETAHSNTQLVNVMPIAPLRNNRASSVWNAFVLIAIISTLLNATFAWMPSHARTVIAVLCILQGGHPAEKVQNAC